MNDDDAEWAMAASVAAVGAAAFARKLLVQGWTRKTGRSPGGAAKDTTWTEALTWAVVSGVVVGVTRIVTERGVMAALGGGPTSGSAASSDTGSPPVA